MGQFFEYEHDGGQPGCGRLGPVPALRRAGLSPGARPPWPRRTGASGGRRPWSTTGFLDAGPDPGSVWTAPCGGRRRLTVRTWHRGGKTALMYRDFDLLAGGVPVGEAVSAWVLAGVEDRKLLRLSQMRELEGTEGGGLCKQLHPLQAAHAWRDGGAGPAEDGVQRYRHQRPCEQHPLRRLRLRRPASWKACPADQLSERAADRLHWPSAAQGRCWTLEAGSTDGGCTMSTGVDQDGQSPL